jgi:hypothetical protein
MSQPVPKEEVIVWFNVHNMNYEQIELCGDVFRTLYQIIVDTYLGSDNIETKIEMTDIDNEKHFDWCWKLLIENFRKENIIIKLEGQHKNYLKSFFLDTFYDSTQKGIKEAIPNFIKDVFSLDTMFSKSDLDILTEVYGLIEKNME